MAFACPHCQKEVGNAVPLERFAKLTEEKNNLDRRVQELEQQAETERAEWQRKEAAWQNREAVWSAKPSNAEGVELALLFYERLPADKRPPLTEWLRNRDALPMGVRVYFEDGQVAAAATPTSSPAPTAEQGAVPSTPSTPSMPAAPTGAQPSASSPVAPALPRSNAGAVAGNGPTTSGYSAESIDNMTLDQYREHRDAILAAHRNR